MATSVSVANFEVKSHNLADEVRTPPKTRVEVVHVHGFTLGRYKLEPGWRWSDCVKPVVKTDFCQVSHVGHLLTGRLTVQLQSGSQKTIGPGESYTIPPGHDAWVEGQEAVVTVEVMGADVYAKPG